MPAAAVFGGSSRLVQLPGDLPETPALGPPFLDPGRPQLPRPLRPGKQTRQEARLHRGQLQAGPGLQKGAKFLNVARP